MKENKAELLQNKSDITTKNTPAVGTNYIPAACETLVCSTFHLYRFHLYRYVHFLVYVYILLLIIRCYVGVPQHKKISNVYI